MYIPMTSSHGLGLLAAVKVSSTHPWKHQFKCTGALLFFKAVTVFQALVVFIIALQNSQTYVSAAQCTRTLS